MARLPCIYFCILSEVQKVAKILNGPLAFDSSGLGLNWNINFKIFDFEDFIGDIPTQLDIIEAPFLITLSNSSDSNS